MRKGLIAVQDSIKIVDWHMHAFHAHVHQDVELINSPKCLFATGKSSSPESSDSLHTTTTAGKWHMHAREHLISCRVWMIHHPSSLLVFSFWRDDAQRAHCCLIKAISLAVPAWPWLGMISVLWLRTQGWAVATPSCREQQAKLASSRTSAVLHRAGAMRTRSPFTSYWSSASRCTDINTKSKCPPQRLARCFPQRFMAVDFSHTTLSTWWED